MLERIGNAVTFDAFFVANRVGKTGLADVTVDVWENGVEIVPGAAATEVGDGLYTYTLVSGSVDLAAHYRAVFKTADATVDVKHLPALWVVGRTWVENVDATVSSRATPASVWDRLTSALTVNGSIGKYILDTLGSASSIAAAVWTYVTRTLTSSAAQVVAAVTGDDLIIRSDVTWSATVTGLSISATRDNVIFTVKSVRDVQNRVADTQSLIQIDEDTGLLRLNGAAATAAQGSLTVAGGLTSLTLALTASATDDLRPGSDYWYDLKQIEGATKTLLAEGRLEVRPTPTRT